MDIKDLEKRIAALENIVDAKKKIKRTRSDVQALKTKIELNRKKAQDIAVAKTPTYKRHLRKVKSLLNGVVTTKYFIFPFAIDGDRTAIPDDTQPSGSVSWEMGFTPDYSLPYPDDPDSRPVPRDAWNQAMFDVTTNIQEYQQWGVPNFISSADNGGTAFPYDKFAFCLYDDGVNGIRVYQSKKTNNTSLPTVEADWIWVDNNANKIIYDNVTFSGVTDGQAVYFNGTNFAPAIANGAAAQNVVGIADVTNARVYAFGLCPLLTGLTPGATYYLSASVAGAITATAPASNQVEVGTALTATGLMLDIFSVVLPGSAREATRVYLGGAQNIGATDTVVEFDQVTFDVAGSFNTGTHRYAPSIAGYYRVSTTLKVQASISNLDIFTQIFKNGLSYSEYLLESNGSSADTTQTITDIVYLNGTSDYITIVCKINNGPREVRAGSSKTFFCAELISN